MTRYTVEECCMQADGCRYLVVGPDGVEVTVDVKDGQLSGRIRGPSRADEDEILRKAFALMRDFYESGQRLTPPPAPHFAAGS